MSSKIEPKCAAEGCREIGTLHCTGCLINFYCGKVCQARDWSQHKGPCKETAALNKKKAEAESADKLARDIQTLCAAGCGDVALERCSVCAGAKYCGRKCQKKHWPEHKGPCKLAAAARAGLGGGIAELDDSIERFKRRAEEGDLDAQNRIGLMLLFGVGVSIDKCEAFKWFKRAAESGHLPSMYEYGNCYLGGDGVAKDEHQGMKWMKRSADGGYAIAQIAIEDEINVGNLRSKT